MCDFLCTHVYCTSRFTARSCGPLGEKHRWNGKMVGKRDKTGKNSTSGYAAKLNFELDRGIGDKVGHANFRGRSAICTRSRVVTHTHTHTQTGVRLYIKDGQWPGYTAYVMADVDNSMRGNVFTGGVIRD